MSASLLFSFVIGYFVLLLVVAWVTSRNSNNDSFFIGNRNSNWMLVAFGMVGTSLSGVTFVSVPGTVGDFAGDGYKGFAYFQVVIGYFFGYLVVAFVLLPLYYKMNLTSIYNYLQKRFGTIAYKTGALFFIISRTVGATARLFLVIFVLQEFILKSFGVPFVVTALIILLMILLYTFEGGVKTIVYTDTLQTTLMLVGLVATVVYILNNMHISVGDAMRTLTDKGYAKIINTDPRSGGFFLKQIIGGAFITISMFGLDQEMMQKNISVKTLKDSQKNMITFNLVSAGVNFLFLLLGGLLYLYAMDHGAHYGQSGTSMQFIAEGKNIIGDKLFPTMALEMMPQAISIIFIIALISALFPSADGALTALTSSFCIDILGLKRRTDLTEKQQKKLRLTVHLSFTVIFLICIMIFYQIGSRSIIDKILDLAGYTYGPLLGLFAFGILSKRSLPQSAAITFICLAAPIVCYLIKQYSVQLFFGYQVGIELLIINGLLTYLGLYSISKKATPQTLLDEPVHL
ncbi:sodium:solute symporter [Niastella koreensis]|uniref:Na+/solute symporter n=2 Tax=Niastella koreensis TaxID=354356 RepID=G8TIC8_NIAKG|nr:sodium:solute symporter [Niastella koreensis]AEW01744.1 Na+/solute symporter [Niastella koreensis GR20-10]OQP48452.1 sodium:solute symporter [Niastella koreensis]